MTLIVIIEGMSVTAGNYYGDKVSYAAGAPRSGGTGQVVLHTKVDGSSQLAVQLVLSGEQFASSYGYELATADLNADGYPISLTYTISLTYSIKNLNIH